MSEENAVPQRQLTFGEYRVGINFNPGGHETVSEIKRRAADLIDFIETIPAAGQSAEQAREVGRLKALAETHIEDAAMWAVKAATKPPM